MERIAEFTLLPIQTRPPAKFLSGLRLQ